MSMRGTDVTTSSPDQLSPNAVDSTERIGADRLRGFTQQVFEQCGMPPVDAEILTDHLVWAELRGLSWLGANKIPEYVARLRAGVTSATGRDPEVHFQRGGFLVVDAEDTFGHVVGYRVMKQVIETARSTGVSAAVIRNTTSAGALGYYVSLAVDENMIGLAINNSPPLQPAPGGAERVIGNQAFAVGSPAGQHPPLVLDMAMSSMSLVRIHDYQRRGEHLPEGIALNADGEPTIDPVAALDGMLLPMGGHRGFGLALLWEVLTGVLAASTTFSTDVGWPGDTSRPQGVSMLLLVVDPTVSMPYETFAARMDDLVDRIHGSRRAAGADEIRLPGERAARTMTERRTDGIPLRPALLTRLRAIAAELGVPTSV
jgi:LDH2 family malate/lactate/ureidoglycolate dehydrogenase